MDIVEFSEAFRNFIIAGATIVTSWAAFTGVNAWRRKLFGETKFDLAKSMMTDLINLEKVFYSTRIPSESLKSFSSYCNDNRNNIDTIFEFCRTNETILLETKNELISKIKLLNETFDRFFTDSSFAASFFGTNILERIVDLQSHIIELNSIMPKIFIPLDETFSSIHVNSDIFFSSVDYIGSYSKLKSDKDDFVKKIASIMKLIGPYLVE